MYSLLIVDDEATERDGLSFLLKGRFPFQTQQESNGKRAWEAMQRQRFDVLLTDVKMPFMDGLELSQLVSEYFPDTIIIIFSAYSEFAYAKRAMQAKAIHYLLKPIELDEFACLMERVVQLCHKKARQQEQQTEQKENQRQLALMRLLSGDGTQMAQHESELSQCGIKLSDKYLRLMHLAAQNDCLTVHGALFSKLAAATCSLEHFCVSFYPTSAFLLLSSDSIIHSEKVAEIAQNLCRNIRQVHGQSISVLISACIHGVDALPTEAAALTNLRKRLYTAQDSILFAHDYLAQDSRSSPEIESARSALETSIERRDLPEMRRRTRLLFDSLRQSKTLDGTYLSHILYDLIARLYIRFDRYDAKALGQRMDMLMRQPDVSQMGRAVDALVEELAAQVEKPDSNDATGAVKRVLRIVQREYASPLSLDYLADRTGVTASYLSYLFKHETGENLVKYLTDYRLKQARRMLEEGSVKVNQVARSCGYDNASYFNRIFKARYGVTPSAIRGQED